MQNQLTETRLSLFALKSDLRGLVEQRCDALDRLGELQATLQAFGEPDGQTALVESIADTNQELVALDDLIRQYLTKELEKIDATAHVILDLTARAAIHRAEADRNYMIAKNEEASVARIKELVLAVMEEFGEKRLRGKSRDLLAKGNGGVRALTVAQPEMVPAELSMVSVRMSLDAWNHMRKFFEGAEVVCEVGRPEPNTSAIRQILESSEKRRAELQKHADAADEVATDREREEWLRDQLAALPGVPGCRLEPRGRHLEIK